jgi:hypothetical protein
VGAVIGGYIILVGLKMGLPSEKILEMVFNLILDLLIGVIPVLGDMLDFVFKSNERNIKIIK